MQNKIYVRRKRCMNFIIHRNHIVDRVQDVMNAVSSRTTIPILTGSKIVASEEGLTFTGSDSDISIEYFISKEEAGDELVVIKEAGGIVLNAKFFGEIVKKLPMDTVEFEVVNHRQTIIKSGKAEFNLNGLDPDEYPHLPQIAEDKTFTIATDLLRSEEHTSELQSRENLVCRLLLEKK